MKLKQIIPHTLSLLVSIGAFAILTSCGPELKQNNGETNASLTATPEGNSDLGEVEAGKEVSLKIAIAGKDLKEAIKLSLVHEGDAGFAIKGVQELPVAGGSTTIVFKADKAGRYKAQFVAKSGAATASVQLVATVKGGGGSQNTGTLQVVDNSASETPKEITELDFGSKLIAANYVGGITYSLPFGLIGRELENTAITVKIENDKESVFSLSETQFNGKAGRKITKAAPQALFKATKEGTFSAEIVATYGDVIKRIPIKASMKRGASDEIITVPDPKPSKVKASLFGKEIPNGTTIVIKTPTADGNGMFNIPVLLNFPQGGYKGQVSLAKEEGIHPMWCMGGVCTVAREITIENPGEHLLEFHIKESELVPGFTNKASFVFSQGDDRFELTLDFAIKK